MTVEEKLDAMQRSPHALAHYKALVEDANVGGVVVHTDFDLTDACCNWDAVTEFELFAYGIDHELAHALAWAQMRYTDFIGCTNTEFENFRDEERAAFPDLFLGERVKSMEHMAAFIHITCGIPYTQALVWTCRSEVQAVRSNLYEYHESEAPSWLFATPADETY
jgi:hypothetical protein